MTYLSWSGRRTNHVETTQDRIPRCMVSCYEPCQARSGCLSRQKGLFRVHGASHGRIRDIQHAGCAAYCLMPSHYHLLIQTPDANLSRCMRHINGVYTQRYNARNGCDGTLFRGRYKSILVEEDAYLLELVRYIHRNPLRAGIMKSGRRR